MYGYVRTRYLTLLFALLCLARGSPLFRLGLKVGKRVSGHDGAQRVGSLIVIRCPDICYVFFLFLPSRVEGRGWRVEGDGGTTDKKRQTTVTYTM